MNLRERKEVRFFAAVWRASPGYAAAWWLLLIVRGVLPTALSLSFGWLVSAVTRDASVAGPLMAVGLAFTAMVTLLPIHEMVSMNLGDQVAAHLYDRLMAAGVSPDGIAHLERPELTNDLTLARDFDQGMLGPPLSISMDLITGGLVNLVIGVVATVVLFGLSWWAPLVLLGGWVATHWLLRESGIWRDRNTPEVQTAQRHAEYAYRLAVEAAPAKELRFFGLAGWVTDRFVATRTRLYELQYEATRLREKSLAGCVVITLATNLVVVAVIARDASNGALSLAEVTVYVQALIGVSAIAFGGLNWAMDGASAPVAALDRLETAMADAGRLRAPFAAATMEQTAGIGPEIRIDDLAFAYDAVTHEMVSGRRIYEHLDLTIPGGRSLAIVGQNGAGKTTLAKLICRLYDPTEGTIRVDGVALTDLDLVQWRQRVAAVFQDFVRFELPLRTNVAPLGAPDEVIRAALADAGAEAIADGNLDTVLSKAYANGTDLSGGQWQRVALARALCAVRLGADVVLLDEPTAQLDVRGEAEIFERLLAAAKGCTTILISHRFSTVRHADLICVVEAGRVIELGSHDELVAAGGRYKTMFELQASRFTAGEADAESEAVSYDAL